MYRAAETDRLLKNRLLKKAVRQRKRDRIVTFAEKLAERPGGELLKVMSNIRRRATGLSNASGHRSTYDDLSVYADYFSEFFAASSAERETVVPYVILSECNPIRV